MTIKKGIALAHTGLLGEDLNLARALSITTLEEFISFVYACESEASDLFRNTDLDRVIRQASLMSQFPVGRDMARYASTRRERSGTGAQPPSHERGTVPAQIHSDDLLEVPPEDLTEEPRALLSDCIGPIKDQGSRGSCVAHTIVAMLECMEHLKSGQRVILSEQFLYWFCKASDGFPDDEGTLQRIAVPLAVAHGVCLNSIWPYDPTPVPGNVGQGPPPVSLDMLFDRGGEHKPTRGEILDPTSIEGICLKLDAGRPVGVSVPVYPDWFMASVERLGHIPMPAPGQIPEGGHAMCVIGYGHDSDFLGGGYLVVRNSWGIDWAVDGPFGQGYGTLPFSYIRHYGWEAFSLE